MEVKNKQEMGRKKNEDRPIEQQTSPINLRVSNEARRVLDSAPKYQRGKILTKLILENKQFIITQNK